MLTLHASALTARLARFTVQDVQDCKHSDPGAMNHIVWRRRATTTCCWTGRPSPASGGGCSAAGVGRPWCCRSGGTATATASARCAPPQCGVPIKAACRSGQLNPQPHMRRMRALVLWLMHSTYTRNQLIPVLHCCLGFVSLVYRALPFLSWELTSSEHVRQQTVELRNN